MEIERNKEDGRLTLVLKGRLDAAWCPAVQQALSGAVREGEHHIRLDMAGVDYISSAGLRVLIGGYKQVSAIGGALSLVNASAEVLKVIELAGLGKLLMQEGAASQSADAGTPLTSPRATWEIFQEGPVQPVQVRKIGPGDAWQSEKGLPLEFPASAFGLGIAALAANREEALAHLGEFLAVSGCAAHLPPGQSSRPDYLLSEKKLVPTAWMATGLAGNGAFPFLARFEAHAETRTVAWTEIVRTAFEIARADAVVVIAAAETAGLVGASRLAPRGEEDPFAFPGVRQRITFTSERAFRDTTGLIVGLAARSQQGWDTHLRPQGENILGHFHAAAFPYRPLRKGRIALSETVTSLFETQGLQTVLHLISDPREPGGAGESEFTRGACWIAPASHSTLP